MSDKDVDAQFADIVAHWDEVESLPDRPARHDEADTADTTASDEAVPESPGAADTAGAGDPLELSDLDDDEHFEPGPLAPLPPQEDLQFWGIIVGLVAGPLILLWLVLFRPDVSNWWTFGALGLTVGGFVLLVLRQPKSRDEDDPDNGARV